MKTIYLFLIAIVLSVSFTSCVKDLNTEPNDGSSVSIEELLRNKAAYKNVLAKCYASLSLTGQKGPAGSSDLEDLDEGYSAYTRLLFYTQVLTTDEALMGSSSNGLRQALTHTWDSSTPVLMVYNRLYITIGFCNDFLRQSTPDKLAGRGQSDDAAFVAQIEQFRNEARFIRAYAYGTLCDHFGAVPFVDETSPIGDTKFFPKQKSRMEIFNFAVNELLDLEDKLAQPKTNEFGRIDRSAAWFLLARLYLNSEVYTGTGKWTEALAYAKKVIDQGGYQLDQEYRYLFMADNYKSKEIIWPLIADGVHGKTYGATTFCVMAQTGGTMTSIPAVSDAIGVNSGWGNIRIKAQFLDKFDTSEEGLDQTGYTEASAEDKANWVFDMNYYNRKDKRHMIFTIGHKRALPSRINSTFTDGYAFTKWRNTNRDGSRGSDPSFTDTDFPLFRLADAMLMGAEAVVRGGTGSSRTEALGWINQVRDRAYMHGAYAKDGVRGEDGTISDAQLTLDFILDERSRELSWELTRRTDLIRFGKFTTGYNWDWKGDKFEGQDIDNKLKLFPIPASDISANPTLTQNPGYTK